MRLTDVLMSFPSLLLALVVLFVFEPGVKNVIIVLAITRIPIYLRTTRAEVLEIRERMFVTAARVMGAGSIRIVLRHVASDRALFARGALKAALWGQDKKPGQYDMLDVLGLK